MVYRESLNPTSKGYGICAGATIITIGTSSINELIIPAATKQRICPNSTIYKIIIIPTEDTVISGHARKNVIIIAAKNPIIAVAATNNVVTSAAF